MSEFRPDLFNDRFRIYGYDPDCAFSRDSEKWDSCKENFILYDKIKAGDSFFFAWLKKRGKPEDVKKRIEDLETEIGINEHSVFKLHSSTICPNHFFFEIKPADKWFWSTISLSLFLECLRLWHRAPAKLVRALKKNGIEKYLRKGTPKTGRWLCNSLDRCIKAKGMVVRHDLSEQCVTKAFMITPEMEKLEAEKKLAAAKKAATKK